MSKEQNRPKGDNKGKTADKGKNENRVEFREKKEEPVKNRIEECNMCGGNDVRLVSNEKVYGGKKYGNGLCYLCFDCGSYVGVHTKSKKPLGILSTKQMRQKKIKCHDLFDPIWKSKAVKRKELYKVLSERLNIPVSQCHFGYFDDKKLDECIRILEDENWYK